jgi:hypothetical protein
MASLYTALVAVIASFLLGAGVIISIPPGPNKSWLFGGQVTWTNAFIHSLVIGAVVLFMGQ